METDSGTLVAIKFYNNTGWTEVIKDPDMQFDDFLCKSDFFYIFAGASLSLVLFPLDSWNRTHQILQTTLRIKQTALLKTTLNFNNFDVYF